MFNALNAELNPICHLLALLGAHRILHVSRIRVKCDGTRAETRFRLSEKRTSLFNPLNAELNPICCLLALLGGHHFLHVSRIRVKSLTLRQLMSFKSAGASVQSTTGSRSVRICGSNAGYTMFRGSVKGTGYPLH